MSLRIAAGLAAVLGLSLAPVAPLFAKPPWVGIELPANPFNRTTRGMYLLVRSYRHASVMEIPVRGNATGLVNGQRRTVPLRFERTDMPGVMGLRKTWPAEGAWVLAINVGGETDGSTALVGVGPDGAVRSINVPTETRQGQIMGRKVTQQDIDAELRAVSATNDDRASRDLGGASALLLVPAAAGLIIARRRR